MIRSTSKILINNVEVKFTHASLNQRGGSTATELNFVVPFGESHYRKYWNQEVLVYFQEGDGAPSFRGRIISSTTQGDSSVQFRALDVIGYLTGNQAARVVLDENNNIDGLSAGGSIAKMIRLANLEHIVGIDYVGDTTPVIKNQNPRGTIVILDEIKSYLQQAIDLTNEDLPRENILVVKDDGTKSQLRLEARADVENETPVKEYSYNKNIVSFGVVERHMPTTIIISGKKTQAQFRHKSAADAQGENFLQLNNPTLVSKAECMDYAQKIFRANTQAKYEYTLNTFEGVYLQENDVIHITDNDTGIQGNFRIIGKVINFSPSSFKLRLTINKRPPILSEFFRKN